MGAALSCNLPCDEPQRHFKFSDDGITDEIIAARRVSRDFIPIPRPRERNARQLSLETEWMADRIQANQFINDVRQRVALWRQGGYAAITSTTRRLLDHWRNPERERRLFFCQIEAIETADPETPRLITDVHTTPANVPDCQPVAAVHARLAARELFPATLLCDRGYVTGAAPASSQARGVDRIGPVRANTSAQAGRPDDLSAAQFQVDFEQRQPVCPAGHLSQTWSEAHPATAQPSVNIRFAADCGRP